MSKEQANRHLKVYNDALGEFFRVLGNGAHSERAHEFALKTMELVQAKELHDNKRSEL